jgi:hypothetical protein
MERIEVEDKPAKRMRLAIVGPTMAVMAITLGLAGFAYSQRIPSHRRPNFSSRLTIPPCRRPSPTISV